MKIESSVEKLETFRKFQSRVHFVQPNDSTSQALVLRHNII